MELDHICGMPILLNTDVDTSEVRYATVCARPVHHTPSSAKAMATLRPAGAHIVSVIVDSAGGCFVYTERSPCGANLFAMKPAYALGDILPADSVVHAFLFTDTAGVVSLGLFDVTRISGVCLQAKGVLERYTPLDKMVRSGCARRPMPAHVTCHWVGHEAACMNFISHSTMTFVVNSVMRVPVDPRNEQCLLVLWQYVLSASMLRTSATTHVLSWASTCSRSRRTSSMRCDILTSTSCLRSFEALVSNKPNPRVVTLAAYSVAIVCVWRALKYTLRAACTQL